MSVISTEWEIGRPWATGLPTLILVKSSFCTDGKLLICKRGSVQRTPGLMWNGRIEMDKHEKGLSLIGGDVILAQAAQSLLVLTQLGTAMLPSRSLSNWVCFLHSWILALKPLEAPSRSGP